MCHVRSVDEAGVLGHAVEDAVLVLQQLVGRRVLHQLAFVEHHDLGGVHDSVESVSYRQHSARRELGPDRFLRGRRLLLLPE